MLGTHYFHDCTFMKSNTKAVIISVKTAYKGNACLLAKDKSSIRWEQHILHPVSFMHSKGHGQRWMINVKKSRGWGDIVPYLAWRELCKLKKVIKKRWSKSCTWIRHKDRGGQLVWEDKVKTGAFCKHYRKAEIKRWEGGSSL